jgi:hypothetical protein
MVGPKAKQEENEVEELDGEEVWGMGRVEVCLLKDSKLGWGSMGWGSMAHRPVGIHLKSENRNQIWNAGQRQKFHCPQPPAKHLQNQAEQGLRPSRLEKLSGKPHPASSIYRLI